eukprot:g6034.t1
MCEHFGLAFEPLVDRIRKVLTLREAEFQKKKALEVREQKKKKDDNEEKLEPGDDQEENIGEENAEDGGDGEDEGGDKEDEGKTDTTETVEQIMNRKKAEEMKRMFKEDEERRARMNHPFFEVSEKQWNNGPFYVTTRHTRYVERISVSEIVAKMLDGNENIGMMYAKDFEDMREPEVEEEEDEDSEDDEDDSEEEETEFAEKTENGDVEKEEVDAVEKEEEEAVEEGDDEDLERKEDGEMGDGTKAEEEKDVSENVESSEEAECLVLEEAEFQKNLPDLTVLMKDVVIPAPLAEAMVTRIRSLVMEQHQKIGTMREADSKTQCEERQEDLTDELEERLRKHWPRKGRTEVQYNQPRRGELENHLEKQQRHARALLIKNKRHETKFMKELDEANSHITSYLRGQQKLQSKLIRQKTLAGLQGLQSKAKTARMEILKEFKAKVTQLRKIVKDDPQRLLNQNEEFIKNCRTFENGGNYHPHELQMSADALTAVSDKVTASQDGRRRKIDELVDVQKGALDNFTQFMEAFDACVQELSMREGLGQKYGAPRRKFQERWRSECARSESESNSIKNDLDLLEKISKTELGSNPDFLPKGQTTFGGAVRVILQRLRRTLLSRGKYLEALTREADIEATLPVIDVNDDPNEGVKKVEDENIDDEDDGGGAGGEEEVGQKERGQEPPLKERAKFMEVSRNTVQQCRDETEEMYAAEGRPGETPDTLDAYLEGQKEKATQQREDATRLLREQVTRLHNDVLVKVLPHTLADVAARCKLEVERLTAKERNELEDLHLDWMGEREAHKRRLKPQLSNPNHVKALEELIESEKQRCDESRGHIEKVRQHCLTVEVDQSKVFFKRLLHLSQEVLPLLDSILCYEDFKALPGDETIVKERRSLRRLRRGQRREERGDGGVPLETSERSTESMGGDGGEGEMGEEDDSGGGEAKATLGEGRCRRRRVWKGLRKSKIKLGIEVGEGGSNEEADFEKREDGEEEEKEEKEEDGVKDDDDGGNDEDDEYTPELTSTLTPTQRTLMRARLKEYTDYCAYFQTKTKEMDQTMKSMIEEENQWEENWKKMLGYLKGE